MPNERDGSSHARQIEMTVRAELDEAIAEFDLVARDSRDYASAFNKLTVALGRWTISYLGAFLEPTRMIRSNEGVVPPCSERDEFVAAIQYHNLWLSRVLDAERKASAIGDFEEVEQLESDATAIRHAISNMESYLRNHRQEHGC